MLTEVVEIHFLELPKFRNKKGKNYRENAIERSLHERANMISSAEARGLEISGEPKLK